ncbi:MAG: hypothetical protein KIT45_12635 [Fimbriimonadia bacterium]|nr:hypothetical protein [Fimbriimonadia bacterium]
MTELNSLLMDINRLETELKEFELRFGVRSDDFYAALNHGDLEEFDELDDYRQSFVEWSALYKTWSSLIEKYRQLIDRQPIALQIKSNLEHSHAS